MPAPRIRGAGKVNLTFGNGWTIWSSREEIVKPHGSTVWKNGPTSRLDYLVQPRGLVVICATGVCVKCGSSNFSRACAIRYLRSKMDQLGRAKMEQAHTAREVAHVPYLSRAYTPIKPDGGGRWWKRRPVGGNVLYLNHLQSYNLNPNPQTPKLPTLNVQRFQSEYFL